MKNIFHTTPFEVSREVVGKTIRTGRFDRAIKDTSEQVSIGYVSPQMRKSQNILRKFKDHFGVIALLDDSSPATLDARISWAAYLARDEGIAEDNSLVEIHPLLPEETFSDREMNDRRCYVARKLGSVLKEEYGVEALPATHPILPTLEHDSPTDVGETWGTISQELDGFLHQHPDGQRQLAVLAITTSSYVRSVFSGGLAFEHQAAKPLLQNDILTLRSVGKHPRENLLIGPQPTGILEAPRSQ